MSSGETFASCHAVYLLFAKPRVIFASRPTPFASRLALERLFFFFLLFCSFDPKPVPGNWNGAGCHTNVSTKQTRESGGYAVIIQHMEKLKLQHDKHIRAYGEGNERRLTGHHETSSMQTFSYGVANRGCRRAYPAASSASHGTFPRLFIIYLSQLHLIFYSVRIPRATHAQQRGYYEDRRPASNMDPYRVTGLIASTTLL